MAQVREWISFMQMRLVAVGIMLVLAAGGAVAATQSESVVASGLYFKPDVSVGERLVDVYSKSVSESGPDIKGNVGRYSGVSTYTITAVTPRAIVEDEADQTDGESPSPPVHGINALADGITVCYKGKCQVNNQTSGLFFNPYLWGKLPREVHAGSHWTAKIDKPWEIGPAGTEQVRVVSVDPANGEITLVRHGSGNGPSTDELGSLHAKRTWKMTTRDGEQITVTQMLPGEATWSGYTTVRRGVIIGDEIMLTQQVKLVTTSGKSYNAELRAYTLLDLGSDVK